MPAVAVTQAGAFVDGLRSRVAEADADRGQVATTRRNRPRRSPMSASSGESGRGSPAGGLERSGAWLAIVRHTPDSAAPLSATEVGTAWPEVASVVVASNMQFDLDAGIGDAPQRDEGCRRRPLRSGTGRRQEAGRKCGEHVPGDRITIEPTKVIPDSGTTFRWPPARSDRPASGKPPPRPRSRSHAEHALEEQRVPIRFSSRPSRSITPDASRRQDAGQPGSAEQHGDAGLYRPRGRQRGPGWGRPVPSSHSLVSLVDCGATGGWPLNEVDRVRPGRL